jgi:hypothetical protein
MVTVATLPSGVVRILGRDEHGTDVDVYLNPLDALDAGLMLLSAARDVFDPGVVV